MSLDEKMNDNLLRRIFPMYSSVEIFSQEESFPVLDEICGKSESFEYTWDRYLYTAIDRQRTLFYDFSEKNMSRISKFLESQCFYWLGLYPDKDLAYTHSIGQSPYNEAKGIRVKAGDSENHSIRSVLNSLSEHDLKVTHFLKVRDIDYGEGSVPGGIHHQSAKIYGVKNDK